MVRMSHLWSQDGLPRVRKVGATSLLTQSTDLQSSTCGARVVLSHMESCFIGSSGYAILNAAVHELLSTGRLQV